MSYIIIDEQGNKLPQQGGAPVARRGFKVVEMGAQNGTPVYKYVPDTSGESVANVLRRNRPAATPPPESTANTLRSAGAAGAPLSKGANPFAKPAPNFFTPPADQQVTNDPGTAMPDYSTAPNFATSPGAAAMNRPSQMAGARLKSKVAAKPAVSPLDAAAAEAPMANPADLTTPPTDPLAKYQGNTPALPAAAPKDPLAKYQGPDGLPPEPSILQSAQAATEVPTEDPLARFTGKPTPENLQATTPGTPGVAGTGASAPGVAGMTPWTGEATKGKTSQMPVITDQESLARYKEAGAEGQAEASDQYEAMKDEMANIGKLTPEQQAMREEKKASLDRYTQGLDRSERSKFIDAIANSLGKIGAGVAGLATDTPVGKYYEYTPSGIGEMQAQNAGKKFEAESADITQREGDAKAAQAQKLAARKDALNFAMELPKNEQASLFNILSLTKGMESTTDNQTVQGLSPENITQQLQKMNQTDRLAALSQMGENLRQAKSLEASELEADKRNATQLKIAALNALYRPGTGAGTEVVQPDPQASADYRKAVNFGSANMEMAKGTKMYQDAVAAKDVEAAKKALLAGFETRVKRRAETQTGQASDYAAFASLFKQAMPYITTIDQLENFTRTADELTASPDSPLGSKRYMEKQTQRVRQPGMPQPASPLMQSPSSQSPGAAAPAPATSGPITPKEKTVTTASGKVIPVSQAISQLEQSLSTQTDAKRISEIRAKIQQLKGL